MLTSLEPFISAQDEVVCREGKKKHAPNFSLHLTAYQGKLVSITIENINAK